MDLTSEFHALLNAATVRPDYRPNFLPEVLTRVAVTVLAVDGASLTLLSDELRMPLAASNDEARAAEMVQFTLGDGPCLDTYRTGQPTMLDHGALRARWPIYLDALVEHTTYRAVVSVPLDLGGPLLGALDLYLSDPAGLADTRLADCTTIAGLIATALVASPHADDADPVGPAWLRTPAMHQRATAWVAIGLMSRAADITAHDALSLIRAYAWQQNKTVDEISYELASHSTLARELMQAPPGE